MWLGFGGACRSPIMHRAESSMAASTPALRDAEFFGCFARAGWLVFALSALCAAGCGSSPKAGEPPQSTPQPRAASKAASVQTVQAVPLVAPVAPTNAAAPAPRGDDIVDVQKALEYDPKDPLGNLEAADALDRLAHGAPP